MNAGITSQETSPEFSGYAWLVLVAFFCGFFLIEHFWDKTNYSVSTATSHADYDGTQNRTADRIESSNTGSMAGRLLLAAVGALGLFMPSDKRLSWQQPLFVLMLAFAVWLGCTLLWSIEPRLTLRKLIVLCVFVFTALGISRQLTLREITIILPLGCLLFLLLGLVKEVLHGTFDPFGDYRFTGTTHPNTDAALAAIVCLASASYFSRSSRYRWWTVVVFCVAAAIIALTKSRTTLVALVAALTVLPIIRTRGGDRMLLVGAAVVLVAVGGITAFSLGSQSQRGIASALAMGRTHEVGSLTGRLPLWEELMDSAEEHPYLGHGYLAFWGEQRVEYLSDEFNWEIPNGHNIYLDVLLDGGAIGLFLFVSIFVAALVTATRHYGVTQLPGAAFLVAFICYALCHGMAESFFKLTGAPNFVLVTMLFSLTWINSAELPEELSSLRARPRGREPVLQKST